MALREFLSSSQREVLEAIPVDRAGLIEHYVLSDQDLSLIAAAEEPRTVWVLPFSSLSCGIPDVRCSRMRRRLQKF